MAHDYGFAPNPFGQECTLATCKPKIRKNASVGDWVIGTGSKKMGLEFHLIYLMQVTRKLTFLDYWNAPEYQFKKPIQNGSLIRMHGDNIYYEKADSTFGQLLSLHSNEDESENPKHLKRDTKGKYVLISDNFYYFGNKHILLPEKYYPICSHVRDTYKLRDKNLAAEFIQWIQKDYKKGLIGYPINWREYHQMEIIFN